MTDTGMTDTGMTDTGMTDTGTTPKKSSVTPFSRRALLFSLALLSTITGKARPMAAAAPGMDLDPENTIYMDLPAGRVTIQLRPDLAPNHVDRIKTLTRQGFYDGVVFHRVIADFMAQTGDPTGTGTGGSDLPDLKAEFSDPSVAQHLRGTCSMARTQNPNSANSQFFICLADVPYLDGQYTIWGQVVDGMGAVDAIKKGPPERNGAVRDPDAIIKMVVAADVD